MATDEYLNFDLSIETDAGGYLASVRASPGGDASEPFEPPFTPEGLENLVLKLGRSRTVVRRVATSHDKLAERFGRELYDAVLSGTVGFAFHNSLQEAERQDKGLRLRLNLDRAPELADVPWELLYSPTLHRPLALSTRTPIVRYIGLPFAANPLAVEAPLRVLAVVAAPTDLVDLDTDAEVARIHDATEDLARAGLVHIDRLEHATLIDLVRHLEAADCHVLHFVGHGGYQEQGDSGSGFLAFENDEGLHQLVPGDRLGVLLNDHVPLRLAVLNACEGARTSPTEPFAGVAQSLVRQGIPAVIAMQFEVTDTAATVFGHELYRSLATGSPIDRATAIARKAMLAGNHDVEWATPVLYLRSTSGHLFDVHGGAQAPPEPIDTGLVDGYEDATAALAAWTSTRSRGDLEEAVSLLEQVTRRRPDYRDAGALLAETRDELVRVLYREADASIAGGRRADGLSLLDRIDELDPDHGDPDDLRRRAHLDAEREESRPPETEVLPPVGRGDDAVEHPLPPTDLRSPVERDDDAGAHQPTPPDVTPVVPPRPPPPVDGTVEVARRRWVKPVLAAGALVVLAGVAQELLGGNEVVADTDFAASHVASPTLGGENAWADGLERYPTRHPAEGRDDDPHVSSEWALAWDEDHLYLAVDVVDELVVTPYADRPHRIYRGDGINFNFGRPPDGLADEAPLRDDDVQIMIGPASADADTAVAGVQFASGDGTTCPDGRVFAEGRDAPEVTATSRATVDGYQLAAAVPWSLLGHEPEAGGVYGIVFTVADVDGSEPFARHASRSSHADRFGAKHCPARWQTLALAPG